MPRGHEGESEETRQKILNTTKKLLRQNGYTKTTIRKIVEESGVLTGSIYYFFKNKEDIVQALVLSLIRSCKQKIKERFPDESPLFQYAAICTVELKVMEIDEMVREVYFEEYNSKFVFERMVEQFAFLAKELLDGTRFELNETAYYEKALLIKGAMRSCIAEFYFTRAGKPANSRRAAVDLALTLLGASANERADIIKRLSKEEDTCLSIGMELAEMPLAH